MPEEINRVVTDSISNWFFTTSTTANENLRRAGVADECVFFVGNTMIDTLLAQMPRLQPPDFWAALALRPGQYFVLTLHRPANVDAEQQLQRLLQAIAMARVACRWCFPCIRVPRRACANWRVRFRGCTMSIRRGIWNSTIW
jgi:UDP-N-acetylglucosamine 2-epimerase